MLPMRVEQFDAAHGDPVFLEGSWFLYPDGASRDADPRGFGSPPPTDPVELAKRIVFYNEVKAERARHEFDQFNQQFAVTPYGTRIPTPEEIAKKKELRDLARHWMKKAQAAREVLEEARLPAFIQKMTKEERLAYRREIEAHEQRKIDARNELNKIKL